VALPRRQLSLFDLNQINATKQPGSQAGLKGQAKYFEAKYFDTI
jgi:hypothetical protein